MNFEQIQSFFNTTKKLVLDNPEGILNVKTIDSTSLFLDEMLLAHDPVIRWTKAEVRVYSDFVLCLGKMFHILETNGRWAGQVGEFNMSYAMTEFLGIRGEAIEFERNIFPGFTTLEILQKIEDDLQKKNIEPKHFTDRIIFMSIFNDIE